MNLGKILAEQLGQIAVASPEIAQALRNDGGTMALVVASPTAQATLTYGDQDRYSVTFRSLEVRATGGVSDALDLTARAEVVAQRLTFLEEQLALVEMLHDEQTVQLRSAAPQREGHDLWYWEVTVQSGAQPAATIGRYHWAPGMIERESIAYPATFSLVARITDALDTALHAAEA
jgi:hypothetical protein